MKIASEKCKDLISGKSCAYSLFLIFRLIFCIPPSFSFFAFCRRRTSTSHDCQRATAEGFVNNLFRIKLYCVV